MYKLYISLLIMILPEQKKAKSSDSSSSDIITDITNLSYWHNKRVISDSVHISNKYMHHYQDRCGKIRAPSGEWTYNLQIAILML